ncbi:uncharacterized protein LOC118703701 isoform X2 [Pipistrellus kuhlii]|uniref:uncharacterized protein LOC118703701 isoform X2 n=1 Tax=Pipistrellus kuhlii TaxID=59472 RepID=UPI001E270F78|nr:uncharacterized protein LOC118703701 isoform X2 [Pipistrellus kuhlii]
MGYSKTFYEYREKMKTEVNQAIDIFWDKVNPKKEDQVKEGIKKLEDHFNNTVADIVVAHCEDNQECAPLLPEQQQELRNRIRSKVQEPGSEQKSEPEGSHNESPGDFERMFINAGEGEKRRV